VTRNTKPPKTTANDFHELDGLCYCWTTGPSPAKRARHPVLGLDLRSPGFQLRCRRVGPNPLDSPTNGGPVCCNSTTALP
jgi:hypothetical protein